MRIGLSRYDLWGTQGYRSLMRLPNRIMYRAAGDGWVDVVKVDTEVLYQWEGYVVVGVRRKVG